MMLFDTHCHIDVAEFDADRDRVLADARAAGVTDLLVPAVMRATWPGLIELCASDPHLHLALGMHPVYLQQHGPEDIAALAIHLAWAEKNWIRTITGCAVPADLDVQLEPGNLLPEGEPVVTSATAAALVVLCRRVRDEVTYPALVSMADIDVVTKSQPRSFTPRGVLMHLIWHWTYHSAHIGLIRELWGSDYRWTFGSLGA